MSLGKLRTCQQTNRVSDKSSRRFQHAEILKIQPDFFSFEWSIKKHTSTEE